LIYEQLGGKVGWRNQQADADQSRQLPGVEVVRLLAERAVGVAGRIVQDRVQQVQRDGDGFCVLTENEGVLRALAVLVATGAAPLRLDVPGASRLIHPGLGYSIRTFSHLVVGKRIAVVGETPRSLRGTAQLARKAAHVYLISPGTTSATRPLAAALQRCPNVEVLDGYVVTEAIGHDSLAGLWVERDGVRRMLDVNHAFVDLGLVANTSFVRDLVPVDERGFIPVDSHNATTVPGLFAAGDVTCTPGEQVLVAVGEGARAAMSAYDYLLAIWLATASRSDAAYVHG
jgi:alkyl hydroperoxide reductase subunit F